MWWDTKPQLSTYNFAVGYIEIVITYSSPFSIMVNLKTPFSLIRSIYEADGILCKSGEERIWKTIHQLMHLYRLHTTIKC